MHHWAAKPFGRPMDAVKASGPRCVRLMQVCSMPMSRTHTPFLWVCMRARLRGSEDLYEDHGVDTLDIAVAQTCALLNLATLVYGLALLVYGAMLRTSMRERFGIHGAHCHDAHVGLSTLSLVLLLRVSRLGCNFHETTLNDCHQGMLALRVHWAHADLAVCLLPTGSRCGDLFAWLCCAPCSMCQVHLGGFSHKLCSLLVCDVLLTFAHAPLAVGNMRQANGTFDACVLQEARTLAVNNVELGQWNGPTPGLPVVYFAAAETQAPSVPVMSADVIKPTKP
jgi:hypothetical protein